MEEIWKVIEIDGIKTNYEISNYGRCRNTTKLHWKTQGILSPKINKKTGYVQYCIVSNGKNFYKYAHRLVAQYFIFNKRADQTDVNHIDGNKQNNHLDNLEWCTQSENMQHAIRHNLCSHLVEVDVYSIRGEYVGRFDSVTEAMRQLNIETQASVQRINYENIINHGYQWRRVGIDTKPVKDLYYKWIAQDGCVQLTLNGDFIKHYPKIAQAYRELEVRDNGAISQCCKGNRKDFCGYAWQYAKEYYNK